MATKHSDSLVTEDAVIVVKTRFLDKEETVTSTTITTVLGCNSVELDLHLTPAEMRRFASYFTKGAQWIEDHQRMKAAEPTFPAKKLKKKGPTLRLM